jgi:hypothetical protein
VLGNLVESPLLVHAFANHASATPNHEKGSENVERRDNQQERLLETSKENLAKKTEQT